MLRIGKGWMVAAGLAVAPGMVVPAARADEGGARPVRLRALEKTQALLLGGDRLDLGPEGTAEHPRHMRWNFVSSRRERIEQAVAQWSAQDPQAFPPVPGETEFIPYP